MRAFMRAREGPDEHYRGASPQLQHVPERRHTDGSMVAHPQVTFTLCQWFILLRS